MDTTLVPVSLKTLRLAHAALLHVGTSARLGIYVPDAEQSEAAARYHDRIRAACDELARLTGAVGRRV